MLPLNGLILFCTVSCKIDILFTVCSIFAIYSPLKTHHPSLYNVYKTKDDIFLRACQCDHAYFPGCIACELYAEDTPILAI